MSAASPGNVKSTVSIVSHKEEPKMTCVLEEEEPAIVIIHKAETDKPAM